MSMAVRIYFEYPTRLLNTETDLIILKDGGLSAINLSSHSPRTGPRICKIHGFPLGRWVTVLTRTASLFIENLQEGSICSRPSKTVPIFCKPHIRVYIRVGIPHISLCLIWVYLGGVWSSGIWEQFPPFYFFNPIFSIKNILNLFSPEDIWKCLEDFLN